MLATLQKPAPTLTLLYYTALIRFMTSRWYPLTFRIHWGVSFALSLLAAIAIVIWGLLRLWGMVQQR